MREMKETKEGLTPYYSNKTDKWGFVNEKGKGVIPAIYDDAYSFCEGVAVVKINGKWGYINETGKLVIPAIYDWVYLFREGVARVMYNGKWGHINEKGESVKL